MWTATTSGRIAHHFPPPHRLPLSTPHSPKPSPLQPPRLPHRILSIAMADAGGERPDWGADLVEQARQVAAGTFVRGRAGVQRGAPSAGDLEKAGPGRSSAVQPDAPALAISGEAQKVEAGSVEAQKVGAGCGEAHEVEKVEKVEAGSGEEEAEQKVSAYHF